MTGDDIKAALGIELIPDPEFELGDGLRWRPSLGSIAEGVAVYVCETEEIGASIARRITAAQARGLRTVVAIKDGNAGLTGPLQEFLLEAGVEVVIQSAEGASTRHDDLSRYAQSSEVLLEPSIARGFITRELGRALEQSGEQRGRSLERALAFLLSQVPYWRVRNVNFRTSNEEIDVLIANSSAKAPWNGSSYIVVEAKNWSNNVDRDEYDAFHMKVKERGGSCRLGLFFAAVGFSSGFYERASHHGSEGFSIVPMSVPRLISQIDSRRDVESVLADRVESVVLDRQWEE